MASARQYISALLVLALLGMQFVLGQHYAVHFFEDGAEIAALAKAPDTAPPGKAPQGEDAHRGKCDVCDFAKMLSHASGMGVPALLPPVFATVILALLFPQACRPAALRPYAARASPVAR